MTNEIKNLDDAVKLVEQDTETTKETLAGLYAEAIAAMNLAQQNFKADQLNVPFTTLISTFQNKGQDLTRALDAFVAGLHTTDAQLTETEVDSAVSTEKVNDQGLDVQTVDFSRLG